MASGAPAAGSIGASGTAGAAGARSSAPDPTRPHASAAASGSAGTGPIGGGPAGTDSAGSRSAGSGSPPPGLRHQTGRTKDAVLGLVRAHVDLAKAELGEIVDEIKHVAILASIALSLVLFAGILLPVGFFLWLGESLFGSLGWGALIGSELLVAIAVLILLPVLGHGLPAVRTFILALAVSAVIAAVLGSNITNTAWDRLGEAISSSLTPSTRPLVVAAVVGAIVFAVIGLIAGARAGGGGGAFGGLIGGAVFGALLGASTAITYSWNVAIAIGLTFLFVLWPLFAALAVVRRGIDTEQLKDRFWPDQTIATSKETIEWVRAQTPLARKS